MELLMHRSDMAALQIKHVVLSEAVRGVVGGTGSYSVERNRRDEIWDLKAQNARLKLEVQALHALNAQLTAVVKEHVSGSLNAARQLRNLTDAHYAIINTVADQELSWWAKSERAAKTSSAAVELYDSA